MKFASFLFGLTVGLLIVIISPFLFIKLNDFYHFSVYDSYLLDIVGSLSFIVGSALFLYCSFIFKMKGLGTPVPIEPPKHLIVKDIYRYTRNPMYIGYWLLVFGEFLILGHQLLLFYVLLFMILNHLYVLLWEEKELKKRFGSSYNEYLQTVPRYFPRLLNPVR